VHEDLMVIQSRRERLHHAWLERKARGTGHLEREAVTELWAARGARGSEGRAGQSMVVFAGEGELLAEGR
jgi:hypothetical protein